MHPTPSLTANHSNSRKDGGSTSSTFGAETLIAAARIRIVNFVESSRVERINTDRSLRNQNTCGHETPFLHLHLLRPQYSLLNRCLVADTVTCVIRKRRRWNKGKGTPLDLHAYFVPFRYPRPLTQNLPLRVVQGVLRSMNAFLSHIH
ncbi:hypothetical protein WG66_006848 [Moniliophthora roreri]|nr:hypothetical protein WG66_006848 [Moniliophthora roreri]